MKEKFFIMATSSIMKLISIFFFSLSIVVHISAQNILAGTSLNPSVVRAIDINENNEVAICMTDIFGATENLYLHTFEEWQLEHSGFKFSLDDANLRYILGLKYENYTYKGALITTNNSQDPFPDGISLFSFDSQSGDYWLKKIDGVVVAPENGGDFVSEISGIQSVFAIASPENFPSGMLPTLFQFIKLNEFGELLNGKIYQFTDDVFNGGVASSVIGLKKTAADFYYTGVTIPQANNSTRSSFITQFNLDLIPLNRVKFSNHEMSTLITDSQNNLYWLGKTTESYSFTDNSENSILIKLNANLEVQWSKVYHAENFEYSDSSIEIMPNGNLVLSYSTYGAFPTVLATLDSNGNIISEKGYPFYEPNVYVLPDGSLLLQTQKEFNEQGDLSFRQIIAKTDINGDFDNCETFPTCLQVNEINVELEDFPITVIEEIDELEDRNATIEPYTFNYSDYCNTVPPPNPQFTIPDTLCAHTCFRPTDLYNHFAHGTHWSISKDTLLAEWSDSLSVEFCIAEKGTYEIRQSIWFLGCEYTESHTVEIVAPQEFMESENDYVCEEPPYLLSLPMGFQYADIQWSTGETSTEIEIYESGMYSVTATDTYCQIIDTIALSFLADSLSPPYLTLPSDTILCGQSFPFYLSPQSDYSTVFSLENAEEQDSIIFLNTAGPHEVSVVIENCVFSEQINIESKNCEIVYLPNVFSPNDDGINDIFRPEGIYFQSQNLRIYDRWGNLLFSERGESLEWNGELNGQKLGTGNFVYVFEYLNLLTNEKEVVSGDLLLLR